MNHLFKPAALACIFTFTALAADGSDQPRFEHTPGLERIPGKVYVDEGGREIYWPKAQVSSEDVYSGNLHKHGNHRRSYTDADFKNNGFDASRLGKLPPPGEHPRLYITPDDLQRIRDHVAMGDAAPYYFRVFWEVFKQQTGVGEDGKIPADKIAQVTGVGYSMTSPFLRQILYAQIMNDDELGKELAKRLAVQAKDDINVLNLFDEQFFRDNFWVVSETRWLPDGHPMKARGQWYWPMYPEAYDYSWRWLDEDGRAAVRAVMAKIIKDRFTHFMEIPANHHLINHASMAMLFGSYFLAIEGEEGFNPKQYAVLREKFEEVLEYYIAPDGVMYETVKGFLPWQIYLAMARRENGKPLTHPHVFEHMRQTVFTARNVQNTYASWTRPPVRENPEKNEFAKAFWNPRGDERSRTWQVQGSGHTLPFFTMMHYFYPGRKDFDLIFKSAVHTANMNFFMNKELNTWLRDLEFPALMLAFASDGILDADGQPVDWNKTPIDFMKETSHFDRERGVGQMRSSWDRDGLALKVECRSDFYTGGHETPDLGNFNFAADGIYWAPSFGAYQPAMHRNVITVDGKNGDMPSVSGDFISQEDTPVATTAIMEYSRGMQFNQLQRTELILHPKLTVPYHKWMAGSYGWGPKRTWQAAFAPSTRWFEEYMSSVDFGHWGCQNTGGSWYDRLLPDVDYAWRTLQLVKGEQPFLLILDDVKLDDQVHDFRFNLNLNPDIVLLKQSKPDEMVFGRSDLEKTLGGVGLPLQWKIPKNEPLLFVKVLNRNTDSEYPQPAYEMMGNKAMLAIPARTVSPSFKTLIYPYREGEPTPSVDWSEDRTRLTVTIGEDVYDYHFGVADNGRTVFTMHKNGELAQVAGGRPPRPVLLGVPPVHQGSRYAKDGPDLGPPPQPRDPAPVPVKVFTGTTELRFATTGPAQEIRFTTDGSEPGPASTLYVGPVALNDSATVKAKTFSRYWPWGDEAVSETVEAKFVKQEPTPSTLNLEPSTLSGGLLCEVFEIFVPEWDAKGFVNPSLNYLPDVNKYQPILKTAVDGFDLPPVSGKQPIEEIFKGYYRFTGYLDVKESGVYTFDVLSNGPLRLEVAGQTVIEETGYYHQDNKNRYGQIALAAGPHPVSLTVCDPVFWKKGREGDMPFNVSFTKDGKPAAALVSLVAPKAELEALPANPFKVAEAEVPLLKAVKPDGKLTRGLVRSTFSRMDLVPAGDGWLFSKKAGPAGLFDLAKLKPIFSETVDEIINGSDFDGQVFEYTGWYKAPYDGLYTFVLDGEGNNQLALDGKVIAQNNVPGDKVDGRIRLEAGYHALSLKLGRSGGIVKVQTPADSAPVALTFGDLFRPEAPKLVDNPENFLVLGIGDKAYAKAEQTIKTPMGDYRLGVNGAKVVDDPKMGSVVEFSGEGSGLRLYDWPAVGRYLTMSFWIKLPEKSPRKDLLYIGQEGANGSIESGRVWVTFSRFYTTGNSVMFTKEEQGQWLHLTLQWGPTTKIYVNGELRGKVFAAADPNNSWRPELLNVRSEQLQLFGPGHFGSVQGRIAGLRVYNTLLADEYVKALYEKSRKR